MGAHCLCRPEYVLHRGSTLLPLQPEDISPINSGAAVASACDPVTDRLTVSAISPMHIAMAPPGGAEGAGTFSYPQCVSRGSANSYAANTGSSKDVIHTVPECSYGTTMGSTSTNELNPSVGERMSADYDAFDTAPPHAHDGKTDAFIHTADRMSADYDAFDAIPTLQTRQLSLTSTSADYDTFETPPEAAGTSPAATDARGAESSAPRSTVDCNEQPTVEPYGVFDDSSATDDFPVSTPLKSTPSAIRMRRNSRFETTNFDEIVAYIQKYTHYDPSALNDVSDEEQKRAGTILPSAELIQQRQQYIDSVVSELYSEQSASTVVPFSQDVVATKIRESRRLPHDCHGPGTEQMATPLSPDALTAFSNFDPEAVDRNREVLRASERLVRDVVPALAALLAEMNSLEVHALDVSVVFHYHGVNMRHIGLVRSHIPASTKTAQIRTKLLNQIIVRTLKNICRDFQRRWMRSEQSSSDQGMFLLLSQFLNLIVGSHENSEKFWEERVTVGIIQRYGKCALDGNTSHMHRLRKVPDFLKVCVW